MKAAVLHGIRDMRIEETGRPSADAASGECLVRIRAVGVCGSDVHYYRHGRIGNQVVTGPHILGHEAAGEVAEASGEFREGDRVAIEPGAACGKCEFCQKGNENLCESARFTGWDVNGGFSEFTVSLEDFTYHIPTRLGDVSTAPLMCAGVVGFRAFRLSLSLVQ